MKNTEENKTVDGLYLAIAFLKECNFKCGYCHPFGESKITSGENLSAQELREIINAANDFGFRRYRFTGGECTLLHWFSGTLEYALSVNSQTRVNVCTNGSTLEKHLDLYEKHRDRVSLRISLDSTDERHRRYDFDKILTDKLHIGLSELARRGIPTRFNMVVTQKNRSEIDKVISLASTLGFNVKLLDLYTQDRYIATECGEKHDPDKPVQQSPMEYWRSNYVDLSEIATEMEGKGFKKIGRYNVDGGFGIPMYAFEVDRIKVIFKDSTQGSFFNREECIEGCSSYGTICQEGIYTPHISSNAVLHVNGCHNLNLQWNLRGTTYDEKKRAFREIIELFTDLEHITTLPQPIRFFKESLRRR